MSLVARLNINEYPLLLGDVLVSGLEDPKANLSVPSVGETRNIFPPGSGFVPCALCQKIAVIGDNLAVAWAGSQLGARIVIDELIEKNSLKPFTNKSLMAHFDSIDETLWNQGLGFLGFIKDQLGMARFGFRYLDLKTRLFGRVGLLGSGAADAESMLLQLPKVPEPETLSINPLERSILLGPSLSGVLLGAEFSTYSTLLQYYGAGYEILSLVDGRFQKIPAITYLFWHGTIDQKGIRLDPYQVAGYSYVEDFLLIRTATFKRNPKTTKALSASQKTYVVPPVYRSITELRGRPIQQPELASPWLCNYFVVRHDDRRIAVFANVNYVPKSPPIKFIEEEDGLVIGFKKDWLDATLKKAIETYERP